MPIGGICDSDAGAVTAAARRAAAPATSAAAAPAAVNAAAAPTSSTAESVAGAAGGAVAAVAADGLRPADSCSGGGGRSGYQLAGMYGIADDEMLDLLWQVGGSPYDWRIGTRRETDTAVMEQVELSRALR